MACLPSLMYNEVAQVAGDPGSELVEILIYFGTLVAFCTVVWALAMEGPELFQEMRGGYQ